MDAPLRLIASNPLDQLARTIEALLVVASQPLSVDELAEAADDDAERVEAALAIVAYLGPCSRPDVARIRGVSADSAVANLVERGLITESGRDEAAGGAIRYRTTPLFERVFGLESLSQLPRLDDVGESTEQIRERLHEVAEKRSA